MTKTCSNVEDRLDENYSHSWHIRRELGEWIVRSMPPKSFSAFPSSAWVKLPAKLSWMKELYVNDLLENELNLDPAVLVDVQGA
jgi:hypothetical protein